MSPAHPNRAEVMQAGADLEPRPAAPSALGRLNPRDLAIYLLGVAVWRLLFTERSQPLTGNFVRLLSAKLASALTDTEQHYVMVHTGYVFNHRGETPDDTPDTTSSPGEQFEDDDIPF